MTTAPEVRTGSAAKFDQLSERFHAVLQQYPEYCEVNPKYGNNSGVFGGGHHKEIEQGLLYLNPFEHFVIHVIQSYISEADRPVLVLDEGGMVGESMVVIGYALRHFVYAGKLELFVSNFETQYSLGVLLAEGERRFNFLPIYKDVQVMKQKDGPHQDVLGAMESRIKPLVETQAEIDFIRKWWHLAEYQEGVDASMLADSYPQQIAMGGFHLIHDSFGGLTWSSSPRAAFRSILSCIDSERGGVMSNMMLDGFPNYGSMICTPLSGKEIGVVSPYKILSFPQSPARLRKLSYEMPYFKL